MSQYPPPPPSYGAYDQPPPPGFGYPPGNQGPYYPQPGYPQPPYQPGVNPTTCPPGPGGYYPGQPATQTIKKEEKSDSLRREKRILIKKPSRSFALNEKHKLTIPEERNANCSPTIHLEDGGDKYRSTAANIDEEKQQPFAQESSKDFHEPTTSEADDEKHNLLPPEESNENIKSIVVEESSPLISGKHVVFTESSLERDNDKPISASQEEEESSAAIEFDQNSKTISYLNHNNQRFKEKTPGKTHEMQKLLNEEFEIRSHRSNLLLNNNYRPVILKGTSYEGPTIQPASYTRRGESDSPDFCNDEFCSGDCSEHDNSYRDKLCEGDCCNDDCSKESSCDNGSPTDEQKRSRAAVVKLGYRNPLPPKILNNCQPAKFGSSSHQVITSQPTSYNWREKSSATDSCEEEFSKNPQAFSRATSMETEYRNYPKKVLNNNNQQLENFGSNSSQRVITLQPTPPNRYGRCDCCSGNCFKNSCSKKECCGDECCKGGCCKEGCCKNNCCKKYCCKCDCFKGDSCKGDCCEDGRCFDWCESVFSSCCDCFCSCCEKCCDSFCDDCCDDCCDD